MEQAINILSDQVQTCENMEKWYIGELEKNNYTTADQKKVDELRFNRKKNETLRLSCLIAINILKNH